MWHVLSNFVYIFVALELKQISNVEEKSMLGKVPDTDWILTLSDGLFFFRWMRKIRLENEMRVNFYGKVDFDRGLKARAGGLVF